MVDTPEVNSIFRWMHAMKPIKNCFQRCTCSQETRQSAKECFVSLAALSQLFSIHRVTPSACGAQGKRVSGQGANRPLFPKHTCTKQARRQSSQVMSDVRLWPGLWHLVSRQRDSVDSLQASIWRFCKLVVVRVTVSLSPRKLVGVTTFTLIRCAC